MPYNCHTAIIACHNIIADGRIIGRRYGTIAELSRHACPALAEFTCNAIHPLFLKHNAAKRRAFIFRRQFFIALWKNNIAQISFLRVNSSRRHSANAHQRLYSAFVQLSTASVPYRTSHRLVCHTFTELRKGPFLIAFYAYLAVAHYRTKLIYRFCFYA